MSTLIFRTVAPLITTIMGLASLFLLLRGHNEPGGGFIGGLIGASAFALFAMAFGVGEARRRLRLNPIVISGAGVTLAALSGALSLFAQSPFLTGLWLPGVPLGLPTLFDIGVYLTVFGAITAIALALEDSGQDQ
jgi:multicomponent Na+:H+ antiporter subunit B